MLQASDMREWERPQVGIRFGTDGWRAVIAEDFTFAAVRQVAGAAARVLCEGVEGRRLMVVGFDRRFGSDRFARAAAAEMTAGGVDVLQCREPLPTPVVNFTALNRGAQGALIVTASHNPAIYNGIKLKATGGSAPEAVVERIETALERPARATACEAGRLESIDPLPAYLERLGRLVDLDRIRSAGMTVVVDAMFGTAAGLLPRLIGGDASQVVEINTAHNPLFPGISGPDPVERNLARLKKVVADGSATLGVAFDGDADRLGVVDENGAYVSGQALFALLAHYLYHDRGLRGPIVKSISGSVMIDRLAEHLQVPVVETQTGFTHMSRAMVDERAALAGEESGGFAFAFHMPDRDGVLAALLLLECLATSAKTLAQSIGELEAIVGRWSQRRIDLPLAPESRSTLEGRLAGIEWPPALAGLEVVATDTAGRRVELADGSWLLARPSGTEPMLRLYAEAQDPDTVEQLLAELRSLLAV